MHKAVCIVAESVVNTRIVSSVAESDKPPFPCFCFFRDQRTRSAAPFMEDYTQWYWQEEGRTPFPFRAVDSMHLEALFRQQQTDPVTLKFAHAPWKDVSITKDAITLMGVGTGNADDEYAFLNLKRKVHTPTSAKVSYWDEDLETWVDHQPQDATLIVDAKRYGHTRTLVTIGTVAHRIDLNELLQIEEGRTAIRPIRIKNAGHMYVPDHVKPVAPIDAYECVAVDRDLGRVPGLVDQLKCPITQAVMQVPVVAPDGHTYELEAIEVALKTNGKSPMTNLPMEARFHVNYSLRGIIENAIPKEVKQRYAEKQRAAQRVAQSKMRARKSTTWHGVPSRSKMPRRML